MIVLYTIVSILFSLQTFVQSVNLVAKKSNQNIKSGQASLIENRGNTIDMITSQISQLTLSHTFYKIQHDIAFIIQNPKVCLCLLFYNSGILNYQQNRFGFSTNDFYLQLNVRHEKADSFTIKVSRNINTQLFYLKLEILFMAVNIQKCSQFMAFSYFSQVISGYSKIFQNQYLTLLSPKSQIRFLPLATGFHYKQYYFDIQIQINPKTIKQFQIVIFSQSNKILKFSGYVVAIDTNLAKLNNNFFQLDKVIIENSYGSFVFDNTLNNKFFVGVVYQNFSNQLFGVEQNSNSQIIIYEYFTRIEFDIIRSQQYQVRIGCKQYSNIGCITCEIRKNFYLQNDHSCKCIQNSKLNKNFSQCICKERFYNNNNKCVSCHFSCYYCNDNGHQNCTQCDSNYSNRKIDENSQQCRCISQYFIEMNSTCIDCDPRVCYFDFKIYFQIILNSLKKNLESNSLVYNISVVPYIQFLSNINLKKVIDLGQYFHISKLTYQKGFIFIVAQYYQDINSKVNKIKFNLSNTLEQKFKKAQYVQIQYQYSVIPENNVITYFSDDEYLSQDQYFVYPIYGLLFSCFCTFLIGLYSSKLAVSEMMGSLQIAYFGLFIINYPSPLIKLSLLKYANGFNDILPISNEILPQSIQLLGYSQVIFQNLNVVFFIIMIPLCISALFYRLFQTQRRHTEKYKIIYRKSLGQVTMTSMLFILYNFSVSITFFLSYESIKSPIYILSILQICICLLFIIFGCTMYGLTDYNYFGEFKYMFLWRPYQLNYYFFHIGIRFMTGIVLAANQSMISGIIIIVAFFVLTIITIVRPPFSDKLHSIRCVVNLLVSIIIMILYTIAASLKEEELIVNDFISKIPLIIIILLYIVVFMTLGFVIRQFKTDLEIKRQVQAVQTFVDSGQKQFQQIMKKKIQQSIKNGSTNLAHKIFLNKIKKRKKKRQISEGLQQQLLNVQTLIVPKIDQQGNILNEMGGLTVQKVKQVDQFLKDGLL